MIYLVCFWEFFKTGLFAIGGGLATIPFLRQMAVSHPEWFTFEELTNFVAVSESTPGPIGINIATYAGYKIGSGPDGDVLNGVLTALLCTFSLVLPSFIIVVIIAKALQKFRDNKYVVGAFYGIRPATTALILSATAMTFGGVLVNAVSANTVGADPAVGQSLLSSAKDFKFNFSLSINIVELELFVIFLEAAIIFKKIHPIVFIALGALAGIILKL